MNFDQNTLRALWQEAFEDDDSFLDAFFSTAFCPQRCHTITENGQLKAALYWFDCSCRGKKIAYIYAVATAKAYRGKGLCRQLMEKTHRHLAGLGYHGAILVPGNTGLFHLYEKLGYKTVSGIHEFSCTRAPSDLTLTQISSQEYARLRRQLLPAGSVLQEEENLAFLQTQCSFFSAEHCLLAAHREKDRLFCPELLGDASLAPKILTALNCREGTFRTPGSGQPFAMYHGFTDIPVPTYFGLAFD